MGTGFIQQVLSESQKAWLAHAGARHSLFRARAGPGGTVAWALRELQLHQQAERQGFPRAAAKAAACGESGPRRRRCKTHCTQRTLGHTALPACITRMGKTIPAIAIWEQRLRDPTPPHPTPPHPTPPHPTPPHTTPHHTTSHHTTPPHPTPHHTTPHHTTPHGTTPHHTTPHHTTPHHTTPHHTTPHHTTPHCAHGILVDLLTGMARVFLKRGGSRGGGGCGGDLPPGDPELLEEPKKIFGLN